MYKIVLSKADGSQSKTRDFSSKVSAVSFFAQSIENGSFVGHGLVMDFFRRDQLLCRHEFDVLPGHDNHWIGRLAEIPFPRAGRPVLEGRRYRHSVTITNREAQDLREFGDGNLSLGISRVLLAAVKARQASGSGAG